MPNVDFCMALIEDFFLAGSCFGDVNFGSLRRFAFSQNCIVQLFLCAPWHQSPWDWAPETARQSEGHPGEKHGVFWKRGDPTWQMDNFDSGKAAIGRYLSETNN